MQWGKTITSTATSMEPIMPRRSRMVETVLMKSVKNNPSPISSRVGGDPSNPIWHTNAKSNSTNLNVLQPHLSTLSLRGSTQDLVLQLETFLSCPSIGRKHQHEGSIRLCTWYLRSFPTNDGALMLQGTVLSEECKYYNIR